MNIADDLKHLAVAIDSIAEMEGNPRKHSERNLEAIKRSLKRFGQLKPIVLADDGCTIIAGNGTFQAAVALGWTEIAAVQSGKGGEEAKAYAVADNRTTDLSQFVEDEIRSIFDEMDDELRMDAGFTTDELLREFNIHEASDDEAFLEEGEATTYETPEAPPEVTTQAAATPEHAGGVTFQSMILTGPAVHISYIRDSLNSIAEDLGTNGLVDTLMRVLELHGNKGEG